MANVIGFDPVAWGIDGGRHGGELMRVLAYASTSGEQGIVSLTDCKVHELSVPGSQVVIDPGAVLIRNGAPNVRNQTYVANGRTESRMDVTATDAAGGRSDLVVIQIEDPAYGWPEPAPEDKPTYQYARPFIIEGVPAGTTSFDQLNEDYAAYALARIDIPPSTSTITNGMIKNLREVAIPRSRRVVRGINNQEQYTLYLDDTQWRTWPLFADFDIPVPAWATHVTWSLAFGQIIPVLQNNSWTTGYVRLNIGDGLILSDSIQWEVDPNNATNPLHILNADEYLVPEQLRGTTASFRIEARKIQGTSDIRWHPVSSLALDLTFEERAA